jgi:hypothetical protein
MEKTEKKKETKEQKAELPVPSEERSKLTLVKGLSKDRIEEMRKQLQLLQEFVGQVMIKGEHYGIIPGTSKPTLFKAGAEFLREAYGFEVKSFCVEKKFIPAHEAERKKDYIEYTYRVELFLNGVSVSVCEGSCNNYERRYESMNPFAVMNTIQKMAQKRAYVGAVISATRSSNIFTQDLEDEPELAREPDSGPGEVRMASAAQAKLIWARLKNELQLSDQAAREFIRATVGKNHSRELTVEDVKELLNAIDEAASAETPESA